MDLIAEKLGAGWDKHGQRFREYIVMNQKNIYQKVCKKIRIYLEKYPECKYCINYVKPKYNIAVIYEIK